MNQFTPFIGRISSDLSQVISQQEEQVTQPLQGADPVTSQATEVSENLLLSYLQSQNFAQTSQAQALNPNNYLAAGQGPTGLPTYFDLYFNAYLGDDNQYHAADSSIGSWQMQMRTVDSSPHSFGEVTFSYSAPGIFPLNFVPEFTIQTPRGRSAHYPDTQAATLGSLDPIGTVIQWAGTNPTTISPQWLPCDGSPIPLSQAPGLFSVIGFTYGGAGTHFNLPNIPPNPLPYFIRAFLTND